MLVIHSVHLVLDISPMPAGGITAVATKDASGCIVQCLCLITFHHEGAPHACTFCCAGGITVVATKDAPGYSVLVEACSSDNLH
jgi:hypothetical protein